MALEVVTMKISAILAAKGIDTITITPDASVSELIALLADHGIGAVVVSPDGQRIEGIASERDVVRAMAADPDAGRTGGVRPRAVREIMTAHVSTISPDATVDEAMQLMTTGRFRHLPVAVDGSLAGIISIGDVVKVRLQALEDERAALVDYVTRGG